MNWWIINKHLLLCYPHSISLLPSLPPFHCNSVLVSLCLTLSLCISLSLSPTLSVVLSSLPLFSLSLSMSPSPSLPPCIYISLSPSLSVSLSHSLFLPPSLSLSFYPSLPPSLSPFHLMLSGHDMDRLNNSVMLSAVRMWGNDEDRNEIKCV